LSFEILRNVEKNFAEFHKILPYEISYFSKILAKFRFREIFFPTSHTLFNSIELIKLKHLLFSKLHTNFVARNFSEILQDFFKIYEIFCETGNSEIYFVSTLTIVYREYIPTGFTVIVKSEVGGFTDKSADYLPAKWSLNSGTELIPAVRFRTAFCVLVEYHTCCRFSCFAKLQARYFERVGPDIVITFPSAKNDQLHEGRTSVLAANGSLYCPARLATAYFRCFGLHFGHAASDTSFVNFQLRRAAGSLWPIPHRSLSYSGATEDLRETLAAVGVDSTRTSDKYIKMAGVTAAYQARATSEEVMHLGRWKTLSVPLQYKINSFAFKKRIAEKVPALDADADA
jgi:hypothetical protein